MSFLGRIKGLFNPATYANDSIRYQSPLGSAYANEWQKGGGGTPPHGMLLPAAEACIARTAEVVSSIPVRHMVLDPATGTLERVVGSPQERVLRKPNEYQTYTDFMLNLVRAELTYGNGYAVRARSNGRSFDQLHLMRPHGVSYVVGDDEGVPAVFYRIGQSNGVVDLARDIFVPARDMLHLRRHCPRNPLEGVTPLAAAALAQTTGWAASTHLAAFFTNMSRPSGVLTTDKILTRDQMGTLRAAWEEQGQLLRSGGIPILSGGLKYDKMGLTAADAEIIAAYKLTVEDIARVFGVPLAVIGDLTNASYNNSETLISHWLSTSLAFTFRHIEEALEDLFGFGEGDRLYDRMRFDVDALLRTDMRNRVEALAAGIRGGLYSVNDARRKEGLKPVPFGDEVRVQQQDVPLSAWHDAQEAGLAAPGAPAVPQLPAPDPAPATEDEVDDAEVERTADRFATLLKGAA